MLFCLLFIFGAIFFPGYVHEITACRELLFLALDSPSDSIATGEDTHVFGEAVPGESNRAAFLA